MSGERFHCGYSDENRTNPFDAMKSLAAHIEANFPGREFWFKLHAVWSVGYNGVFGRIDAVEIR